MTIEYTSFMDYIHKELGNASRWSIWFAVLFTVLVLWIWLLSNTKNDVVVVFSTIGYIWFMVYVGLKLKLELEAP
jgi:hypothetical protein